MRSLGVPIVALLAFVAATAPAGCASRDSVVERARVMEERFERVVVVPGDSPAAATLSYDQAVIVGDVTFERGSAELTPRAKQLLDELATWIRGAGEFSRLEIQGHTDDVGSESANLALARRRGEVVREHLHEAAGIEMHRMVVIPVGTFAPRAPNDTPEGRALNRRVVVVVRR